VAEGGESFYVRGMYRQTFATLYQQILPLVARMSNM
jgi:hypothetical protein